MEPKWAEEPYKNTWKKKISPNILNAIVIIVLFLV